MSARERAIVAARSAEEHFGVDTTVLAVGEVLAITEYFVIASADNTRLVKSLVDQIEQSITEHDGSKPIRIEGLDARTWVLMDYGDLVVHVFETEARSFYELERLWNDVERVDWAAPGTPNSAAS